MLLKKHGLALFTCWVHGWLLEWSPHTMGTLSAPAAVESQADSVSHAVSHEPCWNMKDFIWDQGPGKAVMLFLKHKLVFPYWAALNQEGIPWAEQRCTALTIDAQSWQRSPCQVLHGFWMFSQSKLKIPKNPKYFRLGQTKCFSYILLGFYFKFSFRNLSYFKLNEFFLPFSECLKNAF